MTKSIFKPFIGETSFLSESADVAPDESSFVQRGSKNDNSSPSSVPYEGLCEKTIVWNLNSLLARARSNLSSVDPLCSVVPCSISLENAGSPPFQNQCDREVNAERYFCPTSEFVSEGVVFRDNKENRDNIDMGSQFVERTLYESSYREPAEVDVELHAMPSMRHSPPVNLDQSMCCCAHTSSGEKILEETLAQKTMTIHNQSENLPKNESCFNNSQDVHISATKRVHFADVEVEPLNNNPSKRHSSHQSGSSGRASKSLKNCNKWLEIRNCKTSKCLMSCRNDQKRLIFQDIEFLLTGFSNEKQKEIEGLVRKYGGIVLLDIPSPSISRAKKSSTSCSRQLPVVLSSKKLKTTKFLYACAVNALILKVKWLTDSIAASKIKPPDKYMVLPNQAGRECSRSGMSICLSNSKYIFNGVGIMLHGKHGFCVKLAMISKHGCAQVFKTLQSLVQRLDTGKVSIGAIVAEDESRVSRHLRQCACERKIPIVSAIWIVKSLHLGKLIPVTGEKHVPLPMTRIPKFPISLDWSQEI
ncbi:hypothetical protein HS088_TW09G00516 [Tripterygium wilfordii]|uniref:BRCT domain-containing protein n=2 Tax=Tripterygium wilfordii TaxID=458696 RepID=A0A7J7D7Z1_TRIWF|nr:hypothetical protein HS088_TW09G00516 [Tripterygium wilfordii]